MYKFEIPHFAYWWSEGDNQKLVAYMKGYMAKVYPEFKPLKISGKYVICERE